mgnify:CR=1 FL=1
MQVGRGSEKPKQTKVEFRNWITMSTYSGDEEDESFGGIQLAWTEDPIPGKEFQLDRHFFPSKVGGKPVRL